MISKKLFFASLALFFVSLLLLGLSALKIVQADTPSTVQACVDSNGALRLLTKNGSCKSSETLITLATGSSSGGGNGYFGLPFISSYNDLSPLADKFAGHDFSNANLFENVFRSVSIQGVIFKNATLDGVFFDGTDISNSNFQNSTLSHSLFTKTNLTNVDFSNANLSGAGNLDTSNLTGVIWNNTICPDGTNSNSHSNTCIGHLTPP